MEFIGYATRIKSHYALKMLTPYIIQTLLLLVAPALFAASIYMILGRLIRVVKAEKHSLLRLSWLTKIFVFGDVFSFMLQAGGGGLMSSGTISSMELGEKLVTVGLFVQILFFSGFVVTAVVFQRRIQSDPTSASLGLPKGGKGGWMTLLRVVYIASTLILIRSVFRVIEYIQGNDGYLLRNEVWLYIFDAVLMFCAAAMFNVIHPSAVIKSDWNRDDNPESSAEEGKEMAANLTEHSNGASYEQIGGR